jgi:retron-type reverse transcriptase
LILKKFLKALIILIILDRISSFEDKELTELISSFLLTPIIWKNKNMELPFTYKKGVPLGSAISQGLSNIYLYSLDKKIIEFAKKYGDIYFRYIDDICYLTSSKENLYVLREFIENELYIN